jgi:hypothetical protein
MKYRTGFVSNSSSSSFVCALSKLDAVQLAKLLAYQDSEENTDGWTIHSNEDAGLVEGFTTMDNGALGEWCEKHGYNKVRFEGGY